MAGLKTRRDSSAPPRFDASTLFRPRRPGVPAPAPLDWLPAYLPVLAMNRRIDHPMPGSLGRMGDLEVRLARGAIEIHKAQALRYKVFYEEMGATASPAAAVLRRDADRFDAVCDHVLVLDHADPEVKPFRKPEPRVVGTYRLLRRAVAERNGGFYSASEFELAPFLAAQADKRVLELGRSCVLKPYRNKRTVELLWHGVWTYVLHHKIEVMFGCASLEGTAPDELAAQLAFLRQHARAPEGWRVAALPHRHVPMDTMDPAAIDQRAALRALPPLIKGYLRLGAWVGESAVVDHQFGTTDVFLMLPTSRISERYIDYFGADANRHKVAEPVAA